MASHALQHDPSIPDAYGPAKPAVLIFEIQRAQLVEVERDENAIAIVGMACRLPGGAHTPDAFWGLLIQRTSTMQVIPASRFNIADYYVDPALSGADRTNRMGTDKGHFLTEATCFDEGFFNMSPRQAINTDPQQRVLLETVVDALDDAGYRPADEGGEKGWNRERIGMYAASAFVSYEHNMSTSIDAFFVPGVARGFIELHLRPRLPLLQMAGPRHNSLLMRETDAVVAGGTNIITSPEFFVGLNKGFFVSSTGGVERLMRRGMDIRLADALRDDDPIHALILSSVNHSGLAPTLTAPQVPDLAALFTQNCEKAGVGRQEARAVEMHAPGTQAGGVDKQEGEVGEEQVGDDTLYISSIKPNVGHAESSAGIASLIKATMMLRHRIAMPHIGIAVGGRVNPRLGDLPASGILIPTRPTKPTRLTPAGGAGRIVVSVNSFGAQGSNANALIAEYIPPSSSSSPSSASSASSPPSSASAESQSKGEISSTRRQATDPRTHHIIALSAKPHTPLPLIIARFLAHLEANPTIELGSLSYTTTARRVGYPVPMAFSVSSLAELKTQLAGAQEAASAASSVLPGAQNESTGNANTENTNDKAGNGTKKRIGFLLGAGAGVGGGVGVRPDVVLGHSLGEYAGAPPTACSPSAAPPPPPSRSRAPPASQASKQRPLADRLRRPVPLARGAARARPRLRLAAPREDPARRVRVALIVRRPAGCARHLFRLFRWHHPQPATTPMLFNLSGNVLEVGATVDAGYLGTQMQSAVRWDACVAVWMCGFELSPKAILIPLLRSSLPLPLLPLPLPLSLLPFLPPNPEAHPHPHPHPPPSPSPPTRSGAAIPADAKRPRGGRVAMENGDQRAGEAGVPGSHRARRAAADVPHPQAQAQEQQAKAKAMKETIQEEEEKRKRKVRVVFALGTLEVEEAGRRYGFESAEGGMGVAQYLWLAMTCAESTGVVDLRVFQGEGEGGVDSEARISVVISEGGAISFTSGSGALFASATVAGLASASVEASTAQHLVCARKRLLADGTASSFASAVVAQLLDERSGAAARAVVAAECDEAISTVELSSHKAQGAGAGLASPPLTPSDIVALLSSPVFDAGSGAVEAYFFAGTRELGCASWVEYADADASPRESRAMSAVSSITRAPSTVPPFVREFQAPAPPKPFLRALTAPAPLAPSPKAGVVAVSTPPAPAPADAGFTQAALYTTLAQEMGVPTHTIAMSSTLESLGVDSITSLLLRDRLAGLAGGKAWIMWRSGLTVKDLWDHVSVV
ncbi:hypothetical protein B0H16DRAFT_1718285 [Mycena metata]|uniref:Ketosynthase family 3 (KS3) domain-containing protein n=1 Tax=Mycena metata TaxID=1033252 RepID=A0AAD7JGH3_9AGAR|nr:hypothetical protein B0H16DRAFT_1718285 [Mycena metata]